MKLRGMFVVILAAVGGLTVSWVRSQPPNPVPPPAGQGRGAPPQQPDARQFIQQFDRNRDGFLDRSEVPPDMVPIFDQIDTNRDGRISAAELDQYAARTPPPRIPPTEIASFWIAEADQNPQALKELQQVYDLLRRLDANNDGQLSAAEVRAGAQRVMEQQVDAMLRSLDTDRDGRISRQEARGPLAQDFDRIDRNRDGFLDRNELLQAARDSTRAAPSGRGGAPPTLPPPVQPGRGPTRPPTER